MANNVIPTPSRLHASCTSGKGAGNVQFAFNSKHPETKRWDEPSLKRDCGFSTVFPEDGKDLISVRVCLPD